MKIKAKLKGDTVSVKCMAKHEMSTYNQAEKRTGNKDNANFITHIVAKNNGEVVFESSTSQFLSKNPIFKYKYKGKAGDKLEMSWTDRKGKSGKGDTEVK